MARRALIVAVTTVLLPVAMAAAPQGSALAEREAEPTAAAATFDSGRAAYEAGAYEAALRHFSERQVADPKNPALMLNIGSVHYRTEDYDGAENSFTAARERAKESLQAQALYNLGNVAYRQGRLQEAVERFQKALEIDPDDEDAKFNLEFVREEIERRQEAAQQQQQDRHEKQDSGEPTKEAQNDKSPEGNRANEAGNPNDGDGSSDSGRADREGEGPEQTDPNRIDRDADEVGDRGNEEASALDEGAMTAEEAERYLQVLEETRPPDRHRRVTRGRKVEKDW